MKFISTQIANAKARYDEAGGFVGGVFNFFKGRSTFFALFFTFVGTILLLKHMLTMEYVALATAIQGFVVGHSWKQDAYSPTRQDCVSDPKDNS
jgi:hypothetical protein